MACRGGPQLQEYTTSRKQAHWTMQSNYSVWKDFLPIWSSVLLVLCLAWPWGAQLLPHLVYPFLQAPQRKTKDNLDPVVVPMFFIFHHIDTLAYAEKLQWTEDYWFDSKPISALPSNSAKVYFMQINVSLIYFLKIFYLKFLKYVTLIISDLNKY